MMQISWGRGGPVDNVCGEDSKKWGSLGETEKLKCGPDRLDLYQKEFSRNAGELQRPNRKKC